MRSIEKYMESDLWEHSLIQKDNFEGILAQTDVEGLRKSLCDLHMHYECWRKANAPSPNPIDDPLWGAYFLYDPINEVHFAVHKKHELRILDKFSIDLDPRVQQFKAENPNHDPALIDCFLASLQA